jgi:protein-tyrosine phosphatase
MFDLLTHVLPGAEIGPRHIEGAVATLAALAREGVTDVVVAAPMRAGQPPLVGHELQERVAGLERVARQAGVAVRLYPTHEVPLDDDAERLLASGAALTIADGPYVPVTVPTDRLPALLIGTIERLRLIGFVPIVVHACRYLPAQRNPLALVPLVEAGALLLVSPRNLTGAAGPEAERTLRALLDARLSHVFGSGLASLDGEAARYAEGLRLAETLLGPAVVWEMVAEVPHAIVRGLPVEVDPPRVVAHPR